MRLLDVCLTTREEGLRMDVPTIGTPDEPTVLWIVPTAWEDELEVLPQHDPIPLRHWLAILREWGMDVVGLGHMTLDAGGKDTFLRPVSSTV